MTTTQNIVEVDVWIPARRRNRTHNSCKL